MRVCCQPTSARPIPPMMTHRWAAFNAVGAGGVVVQVGVTAVLIHTAGWHYLPATAVGVEAAVVHNFAWHQWWTWNDRPASSGRLLAARFLRFQLLNGAISLAGNLVLVAAMTGLLGVPPVAANLAAIAACAAFNFFASELLVFRSSACAIALLLAAGAGVRVAAQGPATLGDWARHISTLDARHRTGTPPAQFFIHDREGQRGWQETVRHGVVSVVELKAPDVADGEVHQWVGAMFVPDVTLDVLIGRLEKQAGREVEFYPDVVSSKLLGAEGDRLRVYMKLRRTAIVTVTYDTEHAVEYRRIDATRYVVRSEATRIVELKDAGTARERALAPGDDSGFLWRLAAYWRYEAVAGGVLVECESVSLSRPVPTLLRPIARPIVNRIARESLERTLRSLRTMTVSGV